MLSKDGTRDMTSFPTWQLTYRDQPCMTSGQETCIGFILTSSRLFALIQNAANWISAVQAAPQISTATGSCKEQDVARLRQTPTSAILLDKLKPSEVVLGIRGIWVSSEARRKGVGSQLIDLARHVTICIPGWEQNLYCKSLKVFLHMDTADAWHTLPFRARESERHHVSSRIALPT